MLGPLSSLALLVGTLAIHAAAFAFVFRFAAARDLTWRDVLPGACLAAVAWLGLQYIGVAYVGRTTATSSATNGVFAVVLGLLAFLYLTCVVLVLCLELNVVLVDRLPRRVVPAVLALGVAAALAGPVGYALQTAATPHTGSIPTAGPFVQGAFGPGRGGFPGGRPPGESILCAPS